jgi:hypothetical protein
MKIALVGEYSGLHLGLKKGLDVLGHETDIYSDGDAFKKIPVNKVLHSRNRGSFEKFLYYFAELPGILSHISSNYDAIQLVNPYAITGPKIPFAYSRYLFSIFKKYNGYKSLVVAGCESNVQRIMSQLGRSPCPGCLSDQKRTECRFLKDGTVSPTDLAVDFANVVIPFGGPSYFRSYSHERKVAPLLPFPIDTTLVKYSKIKLGKKLRLLHGVSRSGFKGSPVIIEALRIIEKKFPEDFEIEIVERLPFEKYLGKLAESDVMIDQLYGDGLGMNALLSMSAGCIVMTSFERTKIGAVNLTDAPAIDIGRNAVEIVKQMEELRKWPANKLIAEREKSREWVEKNCSPKEIASRVLKYWENTREKKNRPATKEELIASPQGNYIRE